MYLRPYRQNLLDNRGINDFYNMLDSFFNEGWPQENALKKSSFKIDLSEDEKAYTLEAELPGVSKDDIDIRLEDGRLTLTVRAKEEKNEEGKTYLHRERKMSEMSRSMYFKDIDEDGLTAKLNNGILEITLPKAADHPKSKKIEIEE